MVGCLLHQLSTQLTTNKIRDVISATEVDAGKTSALASHFTRSRVYTLGTRHNAAALQTSHKDRTHQLIDQSRTVPPYCVEAMDRRSVYSRSVLAPDPDASEDSRSQVQAYLREFVLEFRLDNAFIYRYEL